MSVSTEVQRTLVKSPPELWAELGKQESLVRHLGEVGEIRVTKVEPESKVEWEADGAWGVVQLKQSGWGTKVTLSLTRALKGTSELPGSEPVAAAPMSEPEPGTVVELQSEPVAVEPQPNSVSEPAVEPQTEPAPAAPQPKPETQPVATQPTPKQGFFARLFKRRQPTPVATEPALQPQPEPMEPEPAVEPQALAQPEPIYPPAPPKPVEPEPSTDLDAELAELEAQMRQQDTELLASVLDRLGAAHHRPFSRA